jgi:alpha-ketoglutarate-dependent taurine dioxygenase
MGLQHKPVSPALGEEIEGLRLDRPFDGETRAALRRLLDERSLLVFRGGEIAVEDQIRLIELLGPVSDEFELGTYCSLVSNVDGWLEDGRLAFHADLTYSASPLLALSLYAQEIEGAVAPTQFLSLRGGYAALPARLRERLAGLETIHICARNQADGSQVKLRPDVEIPDPDEADYATIAEYPRRTWPVVMPHHRTGEPMLFVSEMFSHIAGLPYEDSEALLEEIYGYLHAPENIYTHEWRQNDLVIWDNRAVHHGRPSFRGSGGVRTLRRVIATEEGRSLPEIYHFSGARLSRPFRANFPNCAANEDRLAG